MVKSSFANGQSYYDYLTSTTNHSAIVLVSDQHYPLLAARCVRKHPEPSFKVMVCHRVTWMWGYNWDRTMEQLMRWAITPITIMSTLD